MEAKKVNLTGRDGSMVSAAQAQMMYASQTRKIMGFARTAIPELRAFNTPEFYIFNVGPEEHTWRAPGFTPIHVPACPKDADHSKAVPIMEEYVEEYLGLNSKTELAWYKGFEIADAVLQTGAGMPPSNSLLKRGLFYTRNNPPLPEELNAAKERLVATYTQLVQQAEGASVTNQPKEINDENRRAAKFLGVKADWNKKYVPTIECPGCGEPIPSTLSVHLGKDGCGAVIDKVKAMELFPHMFTTQVQETEPKPKGK